MTLSSSTPSEQRSNRKITQYAVDRVLRYLMTTSPKPSVETSVNTCVTIHDDLNLTVDLFDNRILHINRKPDSSYIESIYVFSGGCYDNQGNPSDTTRERLNGLLAALGDAQIIPKRVRVFMDYDYGMCYLGSGDQKIAFNKNYTNVVFIESNDSSFIFEGCD